MKNNFKFIICICFIAIVFATTSCAIRQVRDKKAEIKFSKEADITISEDTQWIYDLDLLSKQITVDNVDMYYDIIDNSDEIIKKMGFDKKDFKKEKKIFGNEDDEKYNTYSNGQLTVSDLGFFEYKTGQQMQMGVMKLSETEAVQKAKGFLQQYNLLNDNFDYTPIVSTATITQKNIETGEINEYVTEMTIAYYPKPIGEMNILGNSRITLAITDDGVRQMFYNYREYSQKKEVKLISVEQALEKAKKDECMIELESLSAKLEISKVSLHYWEQALSSEILVMQPVYVFTGTSTTEYGGEEEKFAITVQAN